MDPPPQVSPLSLAGHDVGVRMPPLWSSQCPSNTHQVAQTSGGPVEKDGDKANHLPRRHFDYVRIQGKSSRAHCYDSQPTFQPRVCGKRGQVCLPTHPRTGVPWLFGKFSNNVLVPPKRQSKGYQEGLSEVDRQPFSVNQSPVSAGGETLLFNSSSFPSPPSLSLPSEDLKRGSKEKSQLRGNVVPRSGSAARAPLVEGPS